MRDLIVAPVREHSRKPDEIYSRIEQFCAGPYLELYARQRRPGWVSWGNEVGRFIVDVVRAGADHTSHDAKPEDADDA